MCKARKPTKSNKDYVKGYRKVNYTCTNGVR